ncbi:MFS transporter [Nesterenkonia sp. HG001]|uniref:MFS transporter n=1 Tax=Nesterenkonia sp. HG001 TaxID=2983207 RepID=UPI002AC75B42|nr:MFS transporter [Nesterenkonia sp. HG001]MDZ5077503.1 MFS transporter [Nesterenkonia sp. HG001]
MTSAVHADDTASGQPLHKRVIAAWSLWSWGNATVSAVMVTFVFGTYIADAVGPGGQGTQYLTTANAIAGGIIAVTAPVIGQRADRAGRRRLWLTINTFIVVGLVAACFFIKPEQGYLVLGVTLMATMTLFDELANLNYNAMITDIADHERMGRVSGIGWGAGYLGGIVILAIVYFGLVAGDPPYWFGLGDEEAINIRMVAVVAAAWFLLWALPLLFTNVKTADTEVVQDKVSIAESYRRLIHVIVGLWKEDRNTLWFLLASAIYRDGLSAVFTYGAILGVTVFGFTTGDILLFGIAGNIAAALGAFAGGWFDDRIGPRQVIMTCVTALVLIAGVMYFLDVERDFGLFVLEPTTAFWILGLGLCLFVGPAQASSRAFLGRLAPPSRAAELFGLYATAGRSVSFLTPALISLILLISSAEDTDVQRGDKAIILGVVTILLMGLAAMLLVKNPTGPAKMREHRIRS